MTKIVITFFILLSSQSYSQNDVECEKFLIAFLKDKKENIKYRDKIGSYIIGEIKKSQSIDTLYQDNFPYQIRNSELPAKIIFSKKELKNIYAELEQSNNQGWVKNKIPNVTFIEPEKVKEIYDIHSLSKPILIRENTVCIFYYGNTEWGKLSVYIKINGEWKYFARLYEWIT